MKSICIKTNNKNAIQYLLKHLENYEYNDILFSLRKFKNYNNIIIHFTGKNNKLFIENISYILSLLILDIYKNVLLKNILIGNYFYFNPIERNTILETTLNDSIEKR